MNQISSALVMFTFALQLSTREKAPFLLTAAQITRLQSKTPAQLFFFFLCRALRLFRLGLSQETDCVLCKAKPLKSCRHVEVLLSSYWLTVSFFFFNQLGYQLVELTP